MDDKQNGKVPLSIHEELQLTYTKKGATTFGNHVGIRTNQLIMPVTTSLC